MQVEVAVAAVACSAPGIRVYTSFTLWLTPGGSTRTLGLGLKNLGVGAAVLAEPLAPPVLWPLCFPFDLPLFDALPLVAAWGRLKPDRVLNLGPGDCGPLDSSGRDTAS